MPGVIEMSSEETDRQLLVTVTAAAAALAVSPRTLWSLTAPRGPIPAVRIGRAVRYDLNALRTWIAAQQ